MQKKKQSRDRAQASWFHASGSSQSSLLLLAVVLFCQAQDLQKTAQLRWCRFGKSSERTRACSLGLLARSYFESLFRVQEWVLAPVLLTVMTLNLGPAWLLASIVFSPRESAMLSAGPLCAGRAARRLLHTGLCHIPAFLEFKE